jgi:hypothetical protein
VVLLWKWSVPVVGVADEEGGVGFSRGEAEAEFEFGPEEARFGLVAAVEEL